MNKGLLPYFQLTRAANICTVISNIVVAYVISKHGQLGWDLLVLLIISACLYHGGMILNDYLDVESDRSENPARPLPSGAIPIQTAWNILLILFVAANVLAFFVGWQTLVISLTLTAMIVIYDGFIKNGFRGSIVMGTCRYLNWMLGFSIAASFSEIWSIPLAILIYVTGLTYLSKDEHDGKNPKVLFVCIACVVVAFICVLLNSQVGSIAQWSFYAAWLAWCVWLGRTMWICYSDYSRENIGKLMKMLILGIIPLDALIALSQGYLVLGVLVALLLPVSLRMSKRIYVT